MDSVPICDEKDTLVAYLYGECEPGDRERFEAHVGACESCAAEVDALGSVRGALGEWTEPGPAPGFAVVSADTDRAALSWWRRSMQSAWGLAAAAALVLAAAVAIASVEVRWSTDGFAFRMGWSEPPAAVGLAPVDDDEDEGGARALAAPPPWRAELAALEGALRAELIARRAEPDRANARPGSAAPSGPAVENASGEELLRRIQILIEESEQRQQQELASGLLTLAQEFDLQRREDQLRVQQEFGSLADYLVRVSGR